LPLTQLGGTLLGIQLIFSLNAACRARSWYAKPTAGKAVLKPSAERYACQGTGKCPGNDVRYDFNGKCKAKNWRVDGELFENREGNPP
jgi:hypothetical protein